MMTSRALAILVASLAAAACADPNAAPPRVRSYPLVGPLVPATTTMVSAWDVPKNPLEGVGWRHWMQARQIQRGYRIFTHTPAEAPRFAGNDLSCANCHLNAGQREKALPLVGVAAIFPEYNKRAGRPFVLEDRVIDCFMRSQNSVGRSPDLLPSHDSEEVAAVAAYIRWLSEGYAAGAPIAWRGQNAVADANRVPVAQLDRDRGRALYDEKCVNCHGLDGQGVQIGDRKAGPLWGPASWNDGAGAARVYTLAGMIRYMMPYLDPGSLGDRDAQDLAAYIDAQPRPAFPFKPQDYIVEKRPPDAVYYK